MHAKRIIWIEELRNCQASQKHRRYSNQTSKANHQRQRIDCVYKLKRIEMNTYWDINGNSKTLENVKAQQFSTVFASSKHTSLGFICTSRGECVCVCVKGVSESERKATVFYKTSNDFQFRALSSSGFLFMWTLKRKPMSAYVFICKEAYCVIVKRLQTKQKLSRKLCGKER